MNHRKEIRRVGARGRRKEDLKKYEQLLNSTHKADKAIEKKLKIAKQDVEALNLALGD